MVDVSLGIRTAGLRVALNDMRALHALGGALPTTLALDDGTTLHVGPMIASDKTIGYEAGDVVPGRFEVRRKTAAGKLMGPAYFVP